MRGDTTGEAVSYTDLYYSDDEEYKGGEWRKSANVSKGGTTSIELEEGMYVKLSGCRLVYDTKGE